MGSMWSSDFFTRVTYRVSLSDSLFVPCFESFILFIESGLFSWVLGIFFDFVLSLPFPFFFYQINIKASCLTAT